MIETAENLAREYQISREVSAAFALRSHQRAAATWDNGVFAEEVVLVTIKQRRRDPVMCSQDKGIRWDASPDNFAKLRTIQKDGVVTAASACQQNDVAAACLVVAEES